MRQEIGRVVNVFISFPRMIITQGLALTGNDIRARNIPLKVEHFLYYYSNMLIQFFDEIPRCFRFILQLFRSSNK